MPNAKFRNFETSWFPKMKKIGVRENDQLLRPLMIPGGQSRQSPCGSDIIVLWNQKPLIRFFTLISISCRVLESY